MTKELGYRRIICSIYTTNFRALASFEKIPAAKKTELGVIPRFGYLNGYGWTDMKLTHLDVSLDSVSTFTRMIQRNRSRL